MTWLRLLGTEPGRISPAMPVPSLRRVAAFVVSVLLAGPVMAETVKPASPAKPAATAKPAPAPAAGPKQIGKFDDWTAATHQESGTTVCYAFTRAQTSNPATPSRGAVIITITQRPTLRDAVAIDAGFRFAANAAVTVQVDQKRFDFYTDKRNAFARDGKAVVAAFQKGSRAIAQSPGPKDMPVTDIFSLRGFLPAFAAITRACPATF